MYTILIDESGDTGLQNVAPDPSYGPSQYFTLCATIFREENRSLIERKITTAPYWRNGIHANKLNHFEKIHFCRTIRTLPVGFLGVISNKLTLGDYLGEAQKTTTHYYNKCMQYLLEVIARAMISFRIEGKEYKIVLEARNQRYDSLIAFITRVKDTPLDPRARVIRLINPFSITNARKADDICFALPDLGANALFCAVRRDARAFGLSEPRYIRELSWNFVASKGGKIVPKGIKPIHSIPDLALPKDVASELDSLTNPVLDFQTL